MWDGLAPGSGATDVNVEGGDSADRFTKLASEAEFAWHARAYAALPVSVPEPLRYADGRLTMRRIAGTNAADLWGEGDVPMWVLRATRGLVRALYRSGVCFRDITPYNVMIESGTGDVRIVDFEHCVPPGSRHERFTLEFIDGRDAWNADFA